MLTGKSSGVWSSLRQDDEFQSSSKENPWPVITPHCNASVGELCLNRVWTFCYLFAWHGFETLFQEHFGGSKHLVLFAYFYSNNIKAIKHSIHLEAIFLHGIKQWGQKQKRRGNNTLSATGVPLFSPSKRGLNRSISAISALSVSASRTRSCLKAKRAIITRKRKWADKSHSIKSTDRNETCNKHSSQQIILKG